MMRIDSLRAALASLAALLGVGGCSPTTWVVPDEPSARQGFDGDVLYCTESANFSVGLRIDVGDPLFPSSAAREHFKRCMQDRGHRLARDEQDEQSADHDSLRDRAAAGEVDAEYALGKKYLDTGTSQDRSEALIWLDRAAAKNHPLAMYELGKLSLGGSGFEANFAVAQAWFERALEHGFIEGYFWIASVGIVDEDAPNDPTENYRSILEKATTGDSSAQTILGIVHAFGETPFRDVREGATWLRKAALNDQPFAQYLLGQAYVSGSGVPVNHAEARKWFNHSLLTGDKWTRVLALNGLGEIEPSTDPESKRSGKGLRIHDEPGGGAIRTGASAGQ